MTEASVDVLVKAYVGCRDQLTKLSKDFKEEEKKLKEYMGLIANELMKKADAQGVESFKTPHGTAFKDTKDFVKVDDWSLALNYIIAKNLRHIIAKRVSKDAVKEYMEENDGAVPPGLSYGKMVEIKVRRK